MAKTRRAPTDRYARKQERAPRSGASRCTMSTSKAAERLGISVRAVREAHYRGRIVGAVKAGVLLLDPASVRRYAATREPKGPRRSGG